MNDYHNISYATIILRKILLVTNEIYLVNHIKVYRESEATTASSAVDQPSSCPEERTTSNVDEDKKATRIEQRSSEGHVNDDDDNVGASSFNEIKYFTQVLYEKLNGCLQFLVGNSFNRENCGIVVKFIRVLCNIKTNDDAFSSVATELSSTLCEHHFMIKYYHNTTVAKGCVEAAPTSPTSISTVRPQNQMETHIQIEVFKFLLLHRVDKSQLINVFVGLLDSAGSPSPTFELECDGSVEQLFGMILAKYSNERWSEDEVQLIFSRNLLNILINSNYSFVVDLCSKWKLADVFIRTVLANLDVLDLVSSCVCLMFYLKVSWFEMLGMIMVLFWFGILTMIICS